MNLLLSFVSPLEFILRYTVITGMLVAIFGVAFCLVAKRLTMAIRKSNNISKQDRLFVTFMLLGLGFILIGMIIIALPINATFYKI